jgi:hypothetical protein
MADLVADRGGEAAAACWFLTRSDVDAEAALGMPCISVVAWHLPAWEAIACAACAAGDQPDFAYDLN